MSAASPERAEWREYVSREELAPLLETNDWRGWLSIGLNWGIVAASMALVQAFPAERGRLMAAAMEMEGAEQAQFGTR